MDNREKVSSSKIIGIICISVSWCIMFASLFKALRPSEVSQNYIYYAIFIAGFAAMITGCVLLSLSSHKTILIKDQKETAASLVCLVVENLSIIISALLTEIDILYLLTSKYQDQLKPMGHLCACSLVFMVTGLIGLSNRRAILKLQTVISLCIMVIAVCDLCKAVGA